MWIVRKKKEEGGLAAIKTVVCVIGGNDFGERGGNGVETRMTQQGLYELMNSFVQFMLAELPAVQIRMLDIIPRDSVGGRFASGIRWWNSSVKCLEEGRHRHISCWRVFAVQPHSWKNKMRKEAAAAARENRFVKAVDAKRVELRRGLFGQDKIHLNFRGQKILTKILNWQLNESPPDALEIEFDDGQGKTLILKASFKF